MCCAVMFVFVTIWCILKIFPVRFSHCQEQLLFYPVLLWRELSLRHLHLNLCSHCYYTYTNQHCISISNKIELNQTHIYIQTYVFRQSACSVTKHIIPLIKLTYYTWVVLPKDTISSNSLNLNHSRGITKYMEINIEYTTPMIFEMETKLITIRCRWKLFTICAMQSNISCSSSQLKSACRMSKYPHRHVEIEIKPQWLWRVWNPLTG